MAKIHTITIDPPLINTSCAWASSLEQLETLYNCPHTGAVTTRTATRDGFAEGAAHTVAFASDATTSINSYGYSPHPLAIYLEWIRRLLETPPPPSSPSKPFIISVTASTAEELTSLVNSIQSLRFALSDNNKRRIAIELNTSCPNIPDHPPPSYHVESLFPFLAVFQQAYVADPTLTLGLKLPPYTYRIQFTNVLDALGRFGNNTFAFLTCTNTLGSSLLFSSQTADLAVGGGFALPTPLGGLAGAALHPLALGNVYTFRALLDEAPSPPERARVTIIGVGGVVDKASASRMFEAGAGVVGCATLLGRGGVAAFAGLLDSA
ncbi:hypothetical protein PLICRDRAFT_114308 [Plicaturopsis crispa FD-325 SS-3]|nr:hypothetical protein PLICRDRAFT_114308 [Plicaturopsis crispa FD-325 SS-3]